jgi:hypothetical protein
VAAHERELRFLLPEPVLDVPADERAARTWGNDVLMAVEDVGAFVRILVPIRMTGRTSTNVGAWLGVDQADFNRAVEVWWDRAYRKVQLDGLLANTLPPWPERSLGAPIHAEVVDRDAVPFAVSSSDPVVQRILTEVWDHVTVMDDIDPGGGR